MASDRVCGRFVARLRMHVSLTALPELRKATNDLDPSLKSSLFPSVGGTDSITRASGN